MSNVALIVAAGRGTRAGGARPKQWQPLGETTVAAHAIAAFRDHPAIDAVLVVVRPDEASLLPPGTDWVAGGDSRAASVRAGLEALEGRGPTRVLIHDVARPLVPAPVIDAVLSALSTHPGAAPALPVTDALWSGENDLVSGVTDRTGLWRAQTPQGFRFDAILAAHRALPADAGAADDVAVARAAGLEVAIVPGHEDNLKITAPGDHARAEAVLRARATPHRKDNAMDIRLGNGYDVHRFCAGDHVTLCGVAVPHDRALEGHSDADVGMHAATDAIYGALAEGDIGQHFPPSDPQWKGAESQIFLRHAVELARARGYVISNLDVTLVCERPKVGPHAAAMRAAMAAIMGIEADRVSVKATTSERLGFTGRGEGIAALATAALVSA